MSFVLVKQQLKKPKYKNMYKVEITFMHGDADTYEKESVMLSDENDVIDILEFCHRCKKHYPHGKGGYDDYTGVEGYAEVFEKYFDYWPGIEGIESSYEAVRVTYFNDTGVELDVTVHRVK